MKINVLNIMFDCSIDNQRIRDFLHAKLSNLPHEDCSKVYCVSEVTSELMDEKHVYEIYGNSKICFDQERQELLFYYSPDDDGLYLEWVLLQYIILIMMHNDIYYVHGACLTLNQDTNSAVLIVGQSGSGKTTLELKMLGHGERLVSDDFVVLRKAGMHYAAYQNKARPHIFADNLAENFPEYQKYAMVPAYNSSYKLDIEVELINKDIYAGYAVPRYILIIDNSFSDTCSIHHVGIRKILPFLLAGMGGLKGYTYKKYYEFALDFIRQCTVFEIKKSKSASANIDVFLNFSNGDSHLLDEVGTLFLDLYLKQDDEITILGEINKIYPKVPVETVKNDFNEFIESAFQKGLLI